ncbi:MAG TPA: cyclic peptide export ABC transporter [Pseudolabrys sp.]|nr:cyclic peptide export ABC transporter [Pseudolabrys sp.]
MSFLQLVRREMHGSLPRLLVMSGLGGISTAAILAAINAGLQGNGSLWAATLFLVALFLFIKTQYYVTITTTAEIEAIIHKIRLRLMDHIRRSELLALDAIGRSRIVAAVTSDTAVLTQASNMLCFSIQGAVLIFFVAIYVAFLSLAAIITTALIIGVAGVIFHYKNRRLAAEKQRSAEWEGRLFDRLTDFLDGFKEVRLNSARSVELFEDASEVSRTAANIKINSQAETFKLIVTSQISMYVLIGAVVFVAPQFSEALGGLTLTKTTTALMFIVGACFGLVQSIPILLNANAAADRIEQLEIELQATASTIESEGAYVPRRFSSIDMKGIEFRYVDKFSEAAFKIGPIDFNLRPGELVFITGGNGSGKSTFLRVLAGLYPPDSGEIRLDGRLINDDTRDTYRSLMSAIFFDYHLFRKLYGIPEPESGELDRLLRQFRLAEKTGLVNGEFRTLDLSGGQRRRLALIVSLLEKRPILLLDEWTAEQDPEFRRKFYDELLPELMRSGATVVVITHDDRYLDELHLPARRIRMDEGRIVEQHSIS